MSGKQKKLAADVRACAAQLVIGVVYQGRSLSELLPATQQRVAENERALLAELVYGCLRYYFSLDVLASRFLQKPLREKDADVHALLLLGFYQLRYMRTPEHAAVSLTVDAARALQKEWAGRLLNGVLRQYLRQCAALDASVEQHHNHPAWLEQSIRQAWPTQADAIFAANNQRGGMSLRVNRLQHTAEQYQARLMEAGIVSLRSEMAAEALLLEAPVSVALLPDFARGACSVQDVAAQCCAPLLQLQAGMRVLDACCAPGGKTGHILECEPQLAALLALDSDASRLQRVHDNLARLQLSATVMCADAASPEQWFDGKPFDRILLDAPCSGTGVIRRHPDIKHLRRESDIAALAQRQMDLLRALWATLVPGGILLYTTCSILPQENEAVISAFLQQQVDAQVMDMDVAWGIKTQNGRQLLPTAVHDGFFFARLTKPVC